MKEISEKLAKELHEKIGNAESYAAKMYTAHKHEPNSGDWLEISCMIFDARQHLEWHMWRHENLDNGE